MRKTGLPGGLAFILAFAFWAVIAGCGYRFAGTGELTGGAGTVFISVFKNKSALLGIESNFTDSLIREFTRRRPDSLAEKNGADAFFSGVIESVSTDTVSHRDEYASVERQVRVTVSGRLVSRDGRTLWAVDRISESEDYLVAAEKSVTDQHLRRAVEKLSEELAQRMYNQMTAGF
ncbi:MAG: LPS assembly lipoprotein LptE [Thermodesulfobacteriota bacterium]